MDFIVNVITFSVFLVMCIVSSKLLLDSNFEKFFKQGRVTSIRIAYFIVIFIVAFLTAFCFKELIYVIYNILNF